MYFGLKCKATDMESRREKKKGDSRASPFAEVAKSIQAFACEKLS